MVDIMYGPLKGNFEYCWKPCAQGLPDSAAAVRRLITLTIES